VQDLNPGLAAEVAERYAVPWQGSDYDALLAAPGVDGVVICTPNALHVPQARAALLAGKHVLVQKPLALSAAAAQAVVSLAQAQERLLFVDYTYRYLPTVRALVDLLPIVGRARRLAARFHNIYGPGKAWFFDPALSGGGALIDLGVHLIDLALSLFSPVSASLTGVELSYDQGHPVEDAARLELRLDDLPFELEVSWNAPRQLTEIAFHVDGDSGRARWENVDGSFFHFRTVHDGLPLVDLETSLRSDTLAAFSQAVASGVAPSIDLRVYDLLAQAYATGFRT
jgi:predicted dehydrogenase